MQIKNAGVAGCAEAFLSVQSDSQTSEWYSYFENDVLDSKITGIAIEHRNPRVTRGSTSWSGWKTTSSTSLREGLRKFTEWYKEFYKNILRKEDSLTNENEESTFR